MNEEEQKDTESSKNEEDKALKENDESKKLTIWQKAGNVILWPFSILKNIWKKVRVWVYKLLKYEITKKNAYDLIIQAFSWITFVISGLQLVFLTLEPDWITCINKFIECQPILKYGIPSLMLLLSWFLIHLGKKISPVDFISDFETYCEVCSFALRKIKKKCKIYTIQTPASIAGDNKIHFENYLDATVKALCNLNILGIHRVELYQRLVVLHNINDKKKEEEKLIKFIEKLFSKKGKAGLHNVEILVTKREYILDSAYSNMDVLIVGESSINISFLKYEEQKYEWFTDINIQKNSLLNNYKLEIKSLTELFDDTWKKAIAKNKSNHSNKTFKISFSELEDTELNLDKIKIKIEDIFKEIT